EKAKVHHVDGCVRENGAEEASGREKERPEEKPHHRRPARPDPADASPKLVERSERDRRKDEPDSRGEEAAEEELFGYTAGDAEDEECPVAGVAHRWPEIGVEHLGPA